MSVFDRFLNTTGDSGAGFSMVSAANPLQWTKLGKAIVASLIGAVVIGIQSTTTTLFGALSWLLQGFAGWVSGATGESSMFGGLNLDALAELGGGSGGTTSTDALIPTIESGILAVIEAAWSPLTGLGWIAYPVAIAEILVSLYLVTWAMSYVQEEVV